MTRTTSQASTAVSQPVVAIDPPDGVERRLVSWPGVSAEFLRLTAHGKSELWLDTPTHLLLVHEHGRLQDGEIRIDGSMRSTPHDVARKLSFVPAGHAYREWQHTAGPTSRIYFHIDPEALQTHFGFNAMLISFDPRLLFEDAVLFDTALRLRQSVEMATPDGRLYSEALSVVLVHELVRLHRGVSPAEPGIRGGLASWHQRIVTAYIEEHIADRIPLATLAELVDLSPYHFCRAFKQSFGMPPHRYHTRRRIDRATALLENSAESVTSVGFAVGFSDSSSFTAAFRRETGLTPTHYRRAAK